MRKRITPPAPFAVNVDEYEGALVASQFAPFQRQNAPPHLSTTWHPPVRRNSPPPSMPDRPSRSASTRTVNETRGLTLA